MAKESKKTRTRVHNLHVWILIPERRGLSRYCVNCGKKRYYGAYIPYQGSQVIDPEVLAMAFGIVL